MHVPDTLQRRLLADGSGLHSQGADQLQLTPVPLAPEISLLLSEDPTILWARLEAAAGRQLAAPFWASAWAGGQALARYILDQPTVVAGRRVLDVGSGSGLVAIAAAKAGAASVIANDIDPYAMAAIDANAAVNGVRIDLFAGDLLAGAELDVEVDVVLVGDALYSVEVATRMLPYLARLAERGTDLLVGDPGRGHVSPDWLTPVAAYPCSRMGTAEDSQIEYTMVLAPRRS